MDAVVTRFPKASPAAPEKPLSEHVRAAPQPTVPRPSRDEAEAAVRTLLAYMGDNPDREGLLETPKRFVNAYDELFAGYKECPAEVLDRTFSEIGTYDDLVLVRDIPFYSHCEHHVMPFTGKAHIAYVPTGRVVGLSKIARLIDVYARTDRDRDRGDPQAARLRRHARSRAHLHVDARRGEARLAHRHDEVHRPVRRPAGAGTVHHHGARRALTSSCAGERREAPLHVARPAHHLEGGPLA